MKRLASRGGSGEARRHLPRTHTAYRIGDGNGRYPVYSGEGARAAAGRWNASGQPVIYASEHYSTAMLEKLVRLGEMPPNQHFVAITIPKGTSYEVVTEAVVPTWWEKNALAARTFGAQWYRECRSAVLFVPSVVARMERNVLLHPEHPQTAEIEVSLEEPIWWDERLFDRGR